MQKTISQKDARAAGLKRYFTGEPCKRGHVAERATANSACSDCERERRGKQPLGVVVDLPDRSVHLRDLINLQRTETRALITRMRNSIDHLERVNEESSNALLTALNLKTT